MVVLLALQIGEWIEKLGDPDIETRDVAAACLLDRGEEAVPDLMRATRSGDPEVRVRAADILYRLGERASPSWLSITLRLRKGLARFTVRNDGTVPVVIHRGGVGADGFQPDPDAPRDADPYREFVRLWPGEETIVDVAGALVTEQTWLRPHYRFDRRRYRQSLGDPRDAAAERAPWTQAVDGMVVCAPVRVQPGRRWVVVVVELRNADAVEAARILRATFTPDPDGEPRFSPFRGAGSPRLDFVVSADRRTNSLILMSDPEALPILGPIVAKMDGE